MSWPLLDSQLIGFKAPTNNGSTVFCTKATLYALQALTYLSQTTKGITITCSTNIWSNSCHSTGHVANQLSSSGMIPYALDSPDLVDTMLLSPMGQFPTSEPLLPESPLEEYTLKKPYPQTLSFRDMYGKVFQVGSRARFFVIKSYSPLDVEAAIKHKIWTLTEFGNRRLAKAYEEATEGVYLFYLVNGSSRFCGVAEMQAQIDYTKEADIWVESSRWKGIFPVHWHFVTDIPNKFFRLLRVPENENKPVTNSRDAQELPHAVGVAMLNIFSGFNLQGQRW